VSKGNAVDALIQFWREFNAPPTDPQIHPQDREFFAQHGLLAGVEEKLKQRVTFDSFTKDQEHFQPESPDFHFWLTPIPYVGNLGEAEVVILMLNWGLDYTCYHAEEQPRFRDEVLLPNLRQEAFDKSYPFFCLNPGYCWYGGFEYWEKRFRKMIRKLVEGGKADSYLDGLQKFSQRIAVLQMIPYTSWTFGSQHEKLITESRKKGNTRGILPSAQRAREAAQALKNAGKSLIVVRRSQWWNVSGGTRVLLYKGSEGRGGYFTSAAKKLLSKPWG